MPNVNAPKGLRPIRHLDGTPWNGVTQMYLFPSSDGSACFVGDPVKQAGAAGAAGTVVNGINCEGMPTATVAAAGDTIIGVVVGFLPDQNDLSKKHRVASTNRIALVCTSPDVIYEVQEDSNTSSIVVADIGLNTDFVYAAGSATTGISGVQLDSVSANTPTTATAQLRIMGMVPRPDNEIGTNAKWEVLINEHQYKATTGV